MYKIYPWQTQKWQQLQRCKLENKIPHAILLNGLEGTGKFDFAYNFAQNLLCSHSDEDNCGNCSSCKLLKSGNHPDLFIVKPEPKAKNIKIDQIRDLITNLSNTAQQCGRIVVIINHADLLNNAAANALLKTLEEPAANVFIILTAHNISSLPATIRSRCQIIKMPTPEFMQSFTWVKQNNNSAALLDADLEIALALTQNAPLKTLDILQTDILSKRLKLFEHLYDLQSKKNSIIKVSEACLDWDLNDLLAILMGIASDIIKIKFAIINDIIDIDIINIDQRIKLREVARKIQLDDVFEYQKQLLRSKQDIMQNINLNQQLTLESLFINWLQLF